MSYDLVFNKLFEMLFLDAFAKEKNCEKGLLGSSCPSVCPHGTTRHPTDGFSGNLIFEDV